MYRQSRNQGARLIRCQSCQREFDRATAIDEMFADGTAVGYAEWTGGVVVAGMGVCYPGRSYLLDVRGKIERAHDIEIGRSGSWLAGGLSATFVPQGYIMVAVAPSPDPSFSEPVNLLIQAAGAAPGTAPLSPYREILLEARRVALSAPILTTVLCVAALDLFFEALSGRKVSRNRPSSWGKLFASATGRSLADVIGDSTFASLRCLLAVRHAHAHGRAYVPALPAEFQERERNYLKSRDAMEKPLAPSARWAISVTLQTIRHAEEKANRSV